MIADSFAVLVLGQFQGNTAEDSNEEAKEMEKKKKGRYEILKGRF